MWVAPLFESDYPSSVPLTLTVQLGSLCRLFLLHSAAVPACDMWQGGKKPALIPTAPGTHALCVVQAPCSPCPLPVPCPMSALCRSGE